MRLLGEDGPSSSAPESFTLLPVRLVVRSSTTAAPR